MLKKYSQLFIGLFIGIFLGVLVAQVPFGSNSDLMNPEDSQSVKRVDSEESDFEDERRNNGGVPQKAKSVSEYVRENGRAMEGYVGGRRFQNREKLLPQKDSHGKRIYYREWDVNPRIKGKNRGAERICTGSDGRSWYTNDHYKSFTEIK